MDRDSTVGVLVQQVRAKEGFTKEGVLDLGLEECIGVHQEENQNE